MALPREVKTRATVEFEGGGLVGLVGWMVGWVIFLVCAEWVGGWFGCGGDGKKIKENKENGLTLSADTAVSGNADPFSYPII